DSIKIKNVEYFKAQRDGKILLIVPAIGHLFTVSHEKKEGQKGFQYPVFDLVWIPLFKKLERSKRKNKQYYQNKNLIDVHKKVSQVCSDYIVACDYDIEGSTIGYKILEYCLNQEKLKKANRMKFSSLTETEIINSYKNMMKTLDFNLIYSGICRHEVDYLFGINLTHALTHSTTQLEKINFFLLSTGRVQGPTLAEIVKREKEIMNFIPKDYWVINGYLKHNRKKYDIHYPTDKFFDETKIDEILKECEGKPGIISDIKTSNFSRNPPVPYNLSELQDDAYKFYKYNPSFTLKMAEKLYLDSLISYPRTSNQIIPKSINLKKPIQGLMKDPKYYERCKNVLKTKLIPTSGKKTDPAHPPIIPTGNLPPTKMKKTEEKIFNLVINRFFSLFGEPAIFEKNQYKIFVNGQIFTLSGQKLIKEGWLYFDPLNHKRIKSIQLPPFKLKQQVDIHLEKEKKQTKPPPRYNTNSIRKWMEKEEIGTKATRSDIVNKLYQRKYLAKKRIEPTTIGIRLIEVLEKYVPDILSIEMTRDLENKMNKIEMGEIKKEEVIEEAKDELKDILKKFKKDELDIGREMEKSIIETYEDQNTIGPCPNCTDGILKILYSKKTKKRFIGCTNYPKCTTSFPVAQKGKITSLNRTCKYCKETYNKKYPMVKLNLPGRRPFSTCVNWNAHKKKNSGEKKKDE
ncbi:MAG: DNA topoisomerase I, partial [Promethearchaeota archaeon]